MSSVIIAGDTSGTVTLAAPSVAGTTTLTLPSTSGTVLTSGTTVTAAQGGTGLTSPGTSGNALTSNGSAWTSSAPAAAGFICRAWVNFNGTGTVAIRGSGNVSSITDAGVGSYTVNMTTAISDANYAVTLAARLDFTANFTQGYGNLGGNTGTYSTSAFNISTLRTDNDQLIDAIIVGAAVFR